MQPTISPTFAASPKVASPPKNMPATRPARGDTDRAPHHPLSDAQKRRFSELEAMYDVDWLSAAWDEPAWPRATASDHAMMAMTAQEQLLEPSRLGD